MDHDDATLTPCWSASTIGRETTRREASSQGRRARNPPGIFLESSLPWAVDRTGLELHHDGAQSDTTTLVLVGGEGILAPYSFPTLVLDCGHKAKEER
jgi:hypothetical protein